jgi:hypothetical protein
MPPFSGSGAKSSTFVSVSAYPTPSVALRRVVAVRIRVRKSFVKTLFASIPAIATSSPPNRRFTSWKIRTSAFPAGRNASTSSSCSTLRAENTLATARIATKTTTAHATGFLINQRDSASKGGLRRGAP